MLIRLLLMPLYAVAFVEVGGKNARPVARITYAPIQEILNETFTGTRRSQTI